MLSIDIFRIPISVDALFNKRYDLYIHHVHVSHTVCSISMFQPFWEAVYLIQGYRLLILLNNYYLLKYYLSLCTCFGSGSPFHGASVNHRLLAIHDSSQKQVMNIHAPDGRFLYFFSDPPHLMKTTKKLLDIKFLISLCTDIIIIK